MQKSILCVAVLLLLWGCGESDDGLAATPALVSVSPPLITETEDTFAIEYPCPWMLHTYRTGHAFDQEYALDNLLAELDALIPQRFRGDGNPHTREWATEVILACSWEELKQVEIDEAAKRHAIEAEKADQDFQRKVQEWRNRNAP